MVTKMECVTKSSTNDVHDHHILCWARIWPSDMCFFYSLVTLEFSDKIWFINLMRWLNILQGVVRRASFFETAHAFSSDLLFLWSQHDGLTFYKFWTINLMWCLKAQFWGVVHPLASQWPNYHKQDAQFSTQTRETNKFWNSLL